jgi:hypothetical protein
MPRDKRHQNSELFFRQTQDQEAFGCLQLWAFDPKLRLSTKVTSTIFFLNDFLFDKR